MVPCSVTDQTSCLKRPTAPPSIAGWCSDSEGWLAILFLGCCCFFLFVSASSAEELQQSALILLDCDLPLVVSLMYPDGLSFSLGIRKSWSLYTAGFETGKNLRIWWYLLTASVPTFTLFFLSQLKVDVESANY